MQDNNASGLSQAANHFLLQLVLELKSGCIRRCENYGLSHETIQLLLNLNIEEIKYLIDSPVSVMDIRVNEETLQRLMEHARTEEQRQQRISRALALGASFKLLSRYFGLGSTEIASRRRIAGIESRAGRLCSLDEEIAGLVWQRWLKSGVERLDCQEALDVMMLMAEEMDLSVSVIWNSLREWRRISIGSKENPGEWAS
jgi:hypothetical protein